MATLEERVQAIRERRGASASPSVPMADRVEAIRARRAERAAAPQDAPGVQPQAPAPKPVNPDSISSIVGRSVDQMQAALGGAVETAGELTGSEYLQDAGAQYRQEQLAEASQYGTPTISSYSQVDWQDPEQIGQYLKQMGFSAAPSLAVGVGGGIAGAKAGSAVGGTRGALVGGILGAITSSFPLNVGDVQNAIKEIDPEAKSPWSSVLGGTAMSALDVVGLTSIAKPLVKVFGKDIAYQALKEQGVAKEVATGAIKNALIEAPTEAAQEGIKALAAAEGTDTKVNTEKLIEDMINSAIAGGLAGGGAGGAVGGLGAIANNQNVAGLAADGPQFTEGRTKPLNMAQRAWDALGSSSTNLLQPFARVSPSMEGIIRKLRPDMSGETASGQTIFEDGDLMVGKWTSDLQQKMSNKDLDATVQAYLDDPNSAAAKPLKDIMDDVHKEATDANLSPGYLEGMLPTRLDEADIVARRPEFEAMVGKYYPNPTELVDNYLATLQVDQGNLAPQVNRLVAQDPTTGQWASDPRFRKNKDPLSFRYKIGQGSVAPKFGHLEKSRAFGKVPQKEMQQFAKEQSTPEIMSALRDYFEGAAHRIAAAKAFGPTGEKLNFEVAKAIKEAQKQGYNPTKQEVDRVYDLIDAYNGMYHRIKSEGLKTTLSTASAVATVKALPLAVLSSLVEVAAPAIRGDIKSALLEIAPTIAQVTRDSVRGIMRGTVPRNEFSKFASEANITLASSMNVASQRLGANAFTRGAATGLKYFFLVNGLTLWTHMLSTFSTRVADRVFHDNLRSLASGLPVSSPKGARAANQLRSMGVPVYTNDDAKILYNPKTLSQRETSAQYRRLAMRRFKDQTILEPNIVDTPLWMSNGHLQFLALLNRYPAAFGNIILPALARKFQPSWAGSRANAAAGAVGATFLLSFMLAVGYLQDELKQIAKNGELDYQDDRTEAQRFVDVLNTTVTPLQVGKVLDFVAAPRYGRSGVDTIAGPVVGIAADANKTITAFATNGNEGEIWKFLYKQTPAQFYRPGREAAGEFELFD
jgi:hypothetical protein